MMRTKKLTRLEVFLGCINLFAFGWNFFVLFAYLIMLRVGRIEFSYLALFGQLFRIVLFGLMSYYIIKKIVKKKNG